MSPASPLDEEGEAKAAFHLRMRARGVRDLAVLRAFELVSRRDFVPYRYRDLAARDLALPIGCGQTLDEPWLIASMIEALAIRPTQRVLQVGAGTGYATAILAQIAEEVVGLERFQSLAVAAQARIAGLESANAAVVWADGLAVPAAIGRFERILVHGVLEALPERLLDRLTDDGVLVSVRIVTDGQAVTRVTKSGDVLAETTICACRLQKPIVPGLAASL